MAMNYCSREHVTKEQKIIKATESLYVLWMWIERSSYVAIYVVSIYIDAQVYISYHTQNIISLASTRLPSCRNSG